MKVKSKRGVLVVATGTRNEVLALLSRMIDNKLYAYDDTLVVGMDKLQGVFAPETEVRIAEWAREISKERG